MADPNRSNFVIFIQTILANFYLKLAPRIRQTRLSKGWSWTWQTRDPDRTQIVGPGPAGEWTGHGLDLISVVLKKTFQNVLNQSGKHRRERELFLIIFKICILMELNSLLILRHSTFVQVQYRSKSRFGVRVKTRRQRE